MFFSGQAQHQFADSRFQRGMAAAGMTPKGPLAAHEFSVPVQESGRGDQQRMPRFSGKNPTGGGQEKTIAPAQSRPGHLTMKDLQLVAQDEDLDVLGALGGR